MPVEEAAHSSRSIATASDKYARARLARTRARQMWTEKNVDIPVLGWYGNLPNYPKSDYVPITRIRKGEPFINHDL